MGQSDYQKKLLENLNIPKPSLNWKDKTRVFMGQGMGFKWGDEAVGFLRGLVDPDLTISEAIEDEREIIEKAKRNFPKQSLALEVGGAITTGVATAPFTGGGSLVPTLGRAALIGGTEAAIMGAGGAEGGITERTIGAAKEVPFGFIFGGVGQKVAQVGGEAIKWSVDKIRRLLPSEISTKVATEVQRITQEANLTVPEIMDKINKGEIIAGMNESTRNSLRTLWANTGHQPIIDVVRRREKELLKKTKTELEKIFAPEDFKKNLAIALNKTEDDLQNEATKKYESIYLNSTKNFKGSNKLNIQIQEILALESGVLKSIQKALETQQIPPLFELAKDGTVKLLRDVDLKTAEAIRKRLNILANNAFSKKVPDADLGLGYANLEGKLRNTLDEISPALKNTRSYYHYMKLAQDAAKEGKNIWRWTDKADEFEVYWNKIVAYDDPSIIDAFRLGVAQSIRKRFEGKAHTGKSLIELIRNPEEGEITKGARRVFEMIFPNDKSITEISNLIDLTSSAIKTSSKIIGQSITSVTEGGKKRIGTKIIQNAKNFVLTGGQEPIFLVGMVKSFIDEAGMSLNQKQQMQVADILISENKDLLVKATADNKLAGILVKRLGNIIDRVVAGSRTGVISKTSGSGETIFQELNPFRVDEAESKNISSINIPADLGMPIPEEVKQIINNLDKSTKNKILNLEN